MLEARQESALDDIVVDKILAQKGVNMSHDYRSWYPLKYPACPCEVCSHPKYSVNPFLMILILKEKLKRQP